MLSFAVVSCTMEKVAPENVPSESKVVVLGATLPQTKAAISEDGAFTWQEGDAISVWTGSAFTEFGLTEGAGEKTAQFAGTLPEGVEVGEIAVYPAGNHAYTGSELTLNLPSEYVYEKDNTNIPLVGEVSGEQIIFKAVGGVARFSAEIPKGAAKVALVTGKKVTGDFAVTADGIAVSDEAAQDKVVFLFAELKEPADMVFNFPLPVGEYTMTFQVLDGEDNVITELAGQAAHQIKAADLLIFNELALPARPAVEVKPLFGFQPTVENPNGMTLNAHRTMAVVGDYLILSNAFDSSKMPVYNRFTGEYLGDDIVNTEGVADLPIWAIASDDEGHLAAVYYVDNRTDSGANGDVRTLVWYNGVDQKPSAQLWAGMWHWVSSTYAFSNLKIAGDLSADAVMATAAPSQGVAAFVTYTGGKPDATYPKKNIYEGSSWYSGNVIPVEGTGKTADDIKAITVSGQFRQYISYNGAAAFNLGTGYWYHANGTYQHNAIGGDYIEFGGRQLLGVLNGWYTGKADSYGNSQFYYQLVVSNIGSAPVASSMDEGLIFASRSSVNGDGLEGMGYGVQGMISPFAYSGTVLGPNAIEANQNQIGDVVFATKNGKVQVYGFAMNNGLIGYEITFND